MMIITFLFSCAAFELPAGYWPIEKSQPILDKTETTRLAPDLSSLSAGERGAVDDLLAAGRIVQSLYELTRHHQALEARANLVELDRKLGSPPETRNLLELYRLSHGPVVVTLENDREPFLPVDPPAFGRNVYPWGIKKEHLDGWLALHPEQRDEILGERTVVRRSNSESVQHDLSTLRRHPALEFLHPRVGEQLRALAAAADPSGFYAVPYAIAFADELTAVHNLLRRAADKVEQDDAEFARYLRNRSRDLLTNDYESGDASWVTGNFKRLNAQIGAYETYDDALYGAKAFHSFNILLLNEKATNELRRAMRGLQDIESSLPYATTRRIREDIPVAIYSVIADFGQARGGNTATILPNDPLFARRYGRTILLRENIMKDTAIFAVSNRAWRAAVAPAFAEHHTSNGDFERTLWHEVGHYLGVDRDKAGRDLGVALEDYADAAEEMKADLVSLHAGPRLRESGYYAAKEVTELYASGIRRTLQTSRPREDQPYQRMQLVQFNYFLEAGLLEFDPKATALTIRYEKYPETVKSLLAKVLAFQREGDKAATVRFFDTYTTWKPELHEALATKIKAAQGPRFRIFRYAALGE